MAFHTHDAGDWTGPLTLYSTLDDVLVPAGAQPGDRASFAGFSVPSIDG